MTNHRKKGGSIASDSVNAFVPNFTGKPCIFNKQLSIPNMIDKEFLKQNYGTSFKTTGGRKRNKKNNNYTKKNKNNKNNKNNKKGGNNIYDTFKFYSVPYMGQYMSTYPYYAVNQYNTPIHNNNVMRAGSYKKRKGGSRGPEYTAGDSNPISGSYVPPTIAQKIQQHHAGETAIFTDNRSNVTFPSGLQLACDNQNCLTPMNITNNTNSIRNIQGNTNLDIPETEGYTFEINQTDMTNTPHNYNEYNLPAPRAGGNRNKSNKKNKKINSKNLNKSNKMKNKKGGESNGLASDFQTVLYSRGPYNYPDAGWHWQGQDARQANYQQFRVFNKSSPYIPPSQLSNGGAQFTQAPLTLTPDPYMSNPYMSSEQVVGYNQNNGVTTKTFNGGKQKLNIKYKNVI